MATLSGHRIAPRLAAAAGALLTAALIVGAGPAYAAPSGGPTVEFSGGSMLNLLVCKSSPSSSKVSVPSESRVTFVNRLGQKATLKVDGKAVSEVGANQAVPVLFHYGPAQVSMTFSCGIGVAEEFKPVGVAVAKPAAAATTAGPKVNSGAGGTAKHTTAAPNTPRTSRSGGTGAAAGARDSANTTGPATPAASAGTNTEGTEPIDPSLLAPDSSAAPFTAGDVPAGPGDNQVDVEAAVPASGTPQNGPVGLLALIAAVCAVGVGIAAVRAVMAQRANRASFA
jgi:hypothetical protein